jgi:hypothetical protein
MKLREILAMKMYCSYPIFSMRKLFKLDFQGAKFAVPKDNLIDIFEHQRNLFDATCYDVQSSVPVEFFALIVKAPETGTKVLVTTEKAGSISLLAKEFCLEDLLSECSLFKWLRPPNELRLFQSEFLLLSSLF